MTFMTKTTYTEGQQAGENFERLAKAIFKAPKTVTKKNAKKPKPRRSFGKNEA